MWLRMMVDYYENKKQMEQSYGEYHAFVKGSDTQNTNSVLADQSSLGILELPQSESGAATVPQAQSSLQGKDERHIKLTVDDVEVATEGHATEVDLREIAT